MATPIIKSSGSTSGDVTGVGRNDLVLYETITLTDTEPGNSGAAYAWTLVDIPTGSTSSLSGASTPTATFSPSHTGSYRVRCIVNGSDTSVVVIAVPLATTGARIPGYDEKLEYNAGGNIKGWQPDMTMFMRQSDSTLGTLNSAKAKSTVSSGDTTPGYLLGKLVAGTNVTLTKGSAGADETLTIASTASGGIGATGDKVTIPLSCGSSTSYNSDTHLIVHQFELNPSDYSITGTTKTMRFRAVAAIGYTATGNVRLTNVTDSETVATLTFTSTTPAFSDAALTIGSSSGNIKTSSKVYQVEVWVTSPSNPADSVELGGSYIQITHTVN
jgi:hypothetical protein